MHDIASIGKIFDMLQKETPELIYDMYKSGIMSSLGSGYDTLTGSFAICVFFILYSFIWSILGNNCSKVDQIWSITPVIYSWFYYVHDGTRHPRVLLGCVLITTWGVRLTYNFWRRGGYGNLISHEEDYRWPILRKWINNHILFLLFNLSFIATYQNLLLWFITLPLYECSTSSIRDISQIDIYLTIIFIFLLLIESIADQQQFNFQSKKYSYSIEERLKHEDKDIRNGFLTKGLFTYTRHPNYFAEQSMWVIIYLFAVMSVDGFWLDWTVIGPLQLILLFTGSMTFSESITASKYPAYRLYQTRVSQCIPIPYFFSTSNTVVAAVTSTDDKHD